MKNKAPLLEMAEIETEILYVKEATRRGVLSLVERETIMAVLLAQLREIDERLVIAAKISGRDIGDIDREMLLNERRRWEQKYDLPEVSQDTDFATALPENFGSKAVH